MQSEIVDISSLFIPNQDVEVCCEDCKSVVEDLRLIDGRICPECGGKLTGIRYFRDTWTNKILYAERVEL